MGYYATPEAMENAVRAAARKSPLDTSYAVELFYHDRFLCRVFSPMEPEFVLKGGQSVLARLINARTTRDVDLLASGQGIDEAVDRLVELAARDLGDFFTFRYAGSEDIKTDDEYRTGRKLRFDTFVGDIRKGMISVDLVTGLTPIGELEAAVPRHRLNVRGLEGAKYCLYPVVDTVADKVCAIMQLYSGCRPSSRVKDLVDLVLICLHERLSAQELRLAMTIESRVRGMQPLVEFRVPEEWHDLRARSFAKLAREAALPDGYRQISPAESLVMQLVNPILSGVEQKGFWDPSALSWLSSEGDGCSNPLA